MAIPNIITDLELKLAASTITEVTPEIGSPLTPLERVNNLVNSAEQVLINLDKLIFTNSEKRTTLSPHSLPLPKPKPKSKPKPISKRELTQSGTGCRSSRKRRKGMEEFLDPEKNPDWLPEGWKVEVRIRDTGKTAGSKDTYYREPIKGRKFRSKREVLEFVHNGAQGRSPKRLKNKENSINTLPSKSSQARPINFDSDEQKVRWVRGNSTENSWIPFIGDEMVPEHIRLQWAAMYNPLVGCKYQR